MMTVSGQLDSNFYKTESDEREVYTYVVRPGVQIGLTTAKSKVSFSYTLDAYFYDEKSAVPIGAQPADEEDYAGHWANLDTSYQLILSSWR